MKHPLWIVNSALLVLLVIAAGIIFFLHVNLPPREEIEPEYIVHPTTAQSLHINLNKIYENDLFGTFRSSPLPTTPAEELIAPIPQAPQPEPYTKPDIALPQFLDPLNVTLKGIIIITSDSSKNSAIIWDNRTNTERIYKIGDMLDDAQLIRIVNNKIVLLRANGQQEVLYLREQDAKQDPAYNVIEDWQTVIQQISPYRFIVNPTELISRVQDLAQLIDMLSLTTAYKGGISVGSRIGHLEPKSLGIALGFERGDIITEINGIPATTTKNRVKIYESITAQPTPDTIMVKLLRQGNQLERIYILREFLPQKESRPLNIGGGDTPEAAAAKMDIMKEKYRFAPTIHEIRDKEKEQMKYMGGKSTNR